MWKVYDHDRPLDHPEGYTARLLEIHEDGVVSSTGTSITSTLADIRHIFQRAGLYCTPWQDGDELRVVESWVLPHDAIQTSVHRARVSVSPVAGVGKAGAAEAIEIANRIVDPDEWATFNGRLLQHRSLHAALQRDGALTPDERLAQYAAIDECMQRAVERYVDRLSRKGQTHH